MYSFNSFQYTEEEVGRSYEEFYEDVHTEFLKFGEIINFKVCRNGSFHLRGNVYVQYKLLDSAVMAYNSVHGRYFASKQVKCEFVSLTRWKVAICGEYMKSRLKTCSRGSACNFLHCFTNPGGDYEWADCDKPPPRFWVKKMVALFGYSEDDTWQQPTPKDQHRIFTSDRDRYHEKRHRSIEKNQHNGNSSRSHHDENHVRKSGRHERKKDDKNYEHSDSDSNGDRLRRHHEGSQNHSRHSRSKESKPQDYYHKSKRRTHGSSSSDEEEEDFYTKKRHYNTKSRSRYATNVSESSTEESDDAELKRRERKTDRRRSRRRGRDGGSGEIDGESGEVERRSWRRNERSRSRDGDGDGGCFLEKNEASNRWEPKGSPDELKILKGDGKSSHDRDDKMREKRKRI